VRFGPLVLQRLDQALGRVPEVIVPCRLLPELRAAYRFEYGIEHPGVLRHALDRLTEQMHGLLQARCWGARQVECVLFHETAAATRFEVSLFRPSGSLPHLLGLLRTRLEQVTIDEPVCGMSVRVLSAEPLVDVQAEYVETERAENSRELAGLVDRLSSRLGREAVTRPVLVPDPQPEYACRFDAVIQESGCRKQEKKSGIRSQGTGARKKSKPRLAATPQVCAAGRDPGFKLMVGAGALPRISSELRLNGQMRPLRLWPRPARIDVLRVVPGGAPGWFRWAGHDFHAVRTWGPERIDTGWWRGHDIQRDYYMVSTETGARFWLFRRRHDGCWFLHGCFD
jgi:protein ImuB